MNLDQVIEQLISLKEEVPKPPRLPSELDIKHVENELGIRMHIDLKTFFLRAGNVVYGILEPVQVLSDDSRLFIINVAKEAWESGVGEDYLPICEDNGDYYCMKNDGSIRYLSHNGFSEESWNNLATWIKEVWIGGN